MSDIALRVQGLGKRYRLGLADNAGGGMYRYKSLRDTLGGLTRQPLRTLRDAVVHRPMDESNSFWALKDVDFEVRRGEVVGIIGRNGAGKSTLLKVLSRITKPTAGRVDLFGRVGSLLEVGTGFHPELSGRENVYLNGAILGMTRAEVRAKFDEIVAFSEVEKFLDTPVKQYSSGMYMRLAFAVAAHLEPEILVVDEVLAVGDAEFQRKCLGKMKDVADAGRTVLLVSHNLGQLAAWCSKALLMRSGQVVRVGDARQMIEAYLQPTAGMADDEVVTFGQVTIRLRTKRKGDAGRTSEFLFTDPIELALTVKSERPVRRAGFWLTLSRATGEIVGSFANYQEVDHSVPINGAVDLSLYLRPLVLLPGGYHISLKLFDEGGAGLVFSADSAWSFEITPSPLPTAAHCYMPHHGLIRLTDSFAVHTP